MTMIDDGIVSTVRCTKHEVPAHVRAKYLNVMEDRLIAPAFKYIYNTFNIEEFAYEFGVGRLYFNLAVTPKMQFDEPLLVSDLPLHHQPDSGHIMATQLMNLQTLDTFKRGIHRHCHPADPGISNQVRVSTKLGFIIHKLLWLKNNYL